MGAASVYREADMTGNAVEKSEERRGYRRVSDAIALQIQIVDEAANEEAYDAPELPDYPTHVVSLSPNGLKCYHSEPFNEDEVLQLSMVFFPSKLRIDTTARVVNSGEDGHAQKSDRFFAGLSFIDLEDDKSEQLLEHIAQVARQSFGGAVKLVN